MQPWQWHLTLYHPFPGRGLATASAGTARRAGAGVGALLAGAALATGGYRLYKNEGGLTILPQLMAAPSSTPQPSVSSDLWV